MRTLENIQKEYQDRFLYRSIEMEINKISFHFIRLEKNWNKEQINLRKRLVSPSYSEEIKSSTQKYISNQNSKWEKRSKPINDHKQ